MDFLPDADQDALIEATRQYIWSRLPLTDSLARLDDVRWKEISELGWLGLATDEHAGGAGATLLDEVFVFREVGRGLVPGPILTTLAAARLAAWTGQTTLSTELIAGQARVARAVPLPGDTDRLSVLDAEDSALVLLVDRDRVALYDTPQRLEPSAGLEDGTSVGHAGRTDLGPASVADDDGRTVGRLRRVLSILTSAQLAGICGATRDLATEYAKTRVQFGKPIGAFQAIKHKCADMATDALAADNVTFFAALTESSAATDVRLPRPGGRRLLSPRRIRERQGQRPDPWSDGLHCRRQRPSLRQTNPYPLRHRVFRPGSGAAGWPAEHGDK